MATPAFRSTATTYGFGSPANAQFMKPSGVVAGDILIFQLVSSNAGSPAWPAGFTSLGVVNNGTLHMAAAWKRATESEPASWTFSSGGAADYMSDVTAYSGALETGSPFAAMGPWSTSGLAGKVTITGVEAAPAGSRLVVLFGFQSNGATFTSAPSGFTWRYNKHNANPKHTSALADRAWTGGDTGSLTANHSDSTSTWTGGGRVLALVGNEPPTTAFTAPAEAAKIDPRLPLLVGWSHADVDGNPQAQWELGRRLAGGSWTTQATAANANGSYTIPANTLPDESDIELRIRTHDGTTWGDYVYRTIRSDSWTYLAEETTDLTTGAIPTDGFDPVEYEVGVRTADAAGFGPWSSPYRVEGEQVLVFTGGRWVWLGTFRGYDGAWEANPASVWDGSDWKPTKVR